MPKRHVGSFFHVPTSNPADFDPLITDLAVQVIIFFRYIGGTSYKIITFKNPPVFRSQGFRFFEGELYNRIDVFTAKVVFTKLKTK